MMSEVAERWGWNYSTTTTRLWRAFRRGQLDQIKRPGHQPYYLAHQVEALFGPPNGENGAPVRATNTDQVAFDLDEPEAA